MSLVSLGLLQNGFGCLTWAAHRRLDAAAKVHRADHQALDNAFKGCTPGIWGSTPGIKRLAPMPHADTVGSLFWACKWHAVVVDLTTNGVPYSGG